MVLPAVPPAIRFYRMTLVLSLLNESVAIHLSDRRLTGRNGPVTDEANKTIFLNAFDCRLVMGFSGLARAGNIDTRSGFSISSLSQLPLTINGSQCGAALQGPSMTYSKSLPSGELDRRTGRRLCTWSGS